MVAVREHVHEGVNSYRARRVNQVLWPFKKAPKDTGQI